MRKINIELHPMSALIGALFVVVPLGVVSAGRTPAVMGDLQRVGIVRPVQVDGQLPHPRDWVQIVDGIPFVVPSGKILVVTALGATGDQTATLRVDGSDVFFSLAGFSPTTMSPIPPGFAVPEGRTVTISKDGFSGRAWGYLVDA